MTPPNEDVLKLAQDFIFTHVLNDATCTAHHDTAGKLYALLHLRITRDRPALQHFLTWRTGPENAVRENPTAELMVYQGLFPGRIIPLLLELLT